LCFREQARAKGLGIRTLAQIQKLTTLTIYWLEVLPNCQRATLTRAAIRPDVFTRSQPALHSGPLAVSRSTISTYAAGFASLSSAGLSIYPILFRSQAAFQAFFSLDCQLNSLLLIGCSNSFVLAGFLRGHSRASTDRPREAESLKYFLRLIFLGGVQCREGEYAKAKEDRQRAPTSFVKSC
jgi:hypothetical protein